MAFPSIAAVSEGTVTTDSNRWELTYPGGTINAGDLLMVFGGADGNQTSDPSIGAVSSEAQFAATATSLANAGTSENAEAWVSPSNANADDGTTTSITAATYDSPDISQLLVLSNWGFAIPSGSLITGIVVEIERNNAAGAASDNRVQLAKGTTFANLVGTNKADTATDWPATLATVSYGANNDLWGTTWTTSEINDASFAIMISVQADAANTDIAIDFVRITVHYVQNIWVTGRFAAASNAANVLYGKKVAAGGESGTFIMGLSVAEQGCWKVLHITGWEGTLGTFFVNSDPNGGAIPADGFITGTSTTPESLPMNPFNWDVEDTLFLSGFVADGAVTSSAVPTNYTRVGNAQSSGGASGACLDVASRAIAAASDDAGTFTISGSEEWGAFAMAIRPASAAVSGPPVFGRPRKLHRFTTLR